MATTDDRIRHRDVDLGSRNAVPRRRSPFREERQRKRSRSRSRSPLRRHTSPNKRRPPEDDPLHPITYPRREKEQRLPVEEKTEQPDPVPPAKKKKEDNPLLMRTGGAYIPPARLRMMQEQITDKNSEAYQRIAWEALKKSINGLVNKVNVSNIANIVRELFQENVIRGRGLLGRSIITAQSASPTFTHVYAALVAIVNTKFPQVGELIIKRVIVNFKKGFRRNDKTMCMASANFLAHLCNQQVVHELIALEILTLLLENPTDDSVEVAIGFLKECGLKLSEVAPKGMHGVYDSLRAILNDGKLDVRVQYMIEVMFAIRKDGFKEHPVIISQLDLVEEDDQITHFVTIEEQCDPEDHLNVFKADPDYLANEEKYKQIRDDVLGGHGSSSDSSSGEGSGSEEEEDASEDDEGEMNIQDETQTNTLALRRTIYLTIMSSLSFEECAHKMLQMTIKPGQEYDAASMIIECCSQERSYRKFFGLLGQRFCQLNPEYVEQYVKLFQEHYTTCHRLETNKLRNVAKFYAHLCYSDAIPWTCLAIIHLNEEETTSSSRIFIKILFQELAEYMGLVKLNERLRDPFLAPGFEGLLPRDNPRNTRFSINFFTSIGLGGLTDDLREHLKAASKMIMSQVNDSESSDSTSSSGEDQEEEKRSKHKKEKRKHKRKKSPKEKSKHQKKSSKKSER
ncbi:pre-mRNA-splicing factor CWC22 homolog [Dysidea avara]|uniref:pre-mRNA-splicing factor CWC22 homolog n=1 Tax=Dysidea avara TaxID=196820 RepID=UPI00332556BE